MPWQQNPDTGESFWIDEWQQNPDTGESVWIDKGPQTSDVPTGTADLATASPTAKNDEKARLRQQTMAWADPASPTYKGPGYELLADPNDPNGIPRFYPSDDPEKKMAQSAWEKTKTPAVAAPVLPSAQDVLNPVDTAVKATPNYDALAAFESAVPPAGFGTRAGTQQTARPGPSVSITDRSRSNLATVNAGMTAPGAPADTGAPTLGREHIDPLLRGLDTYQNDIYALSQDNTGLSVAEAQLKKATELANIQAGIETQQSQRGALGIARSVRGRGDRALAERQAIGEAGFIGQDAARTKAKTDATARGDLGILRATEANYDREFQLKALDKAAELGLNRAALEVDISKVDVSSVNNWINNEFTQAGIELQLDAQQTQQLLNYTRDMAAIQFNYDQLSVQDQNEADQLLMQRYSIDEGTNLAIKQMKDAKKLNWNGLLTAAVGGAAQGATSALAGSDRRIKRNISLVSDDELDELLSAVKAETWDYTDDALFGQGTRGRRLGPMTQDLKRTRLGASMVLPQPGGYDAVDTGRAGLAALSGLAHVYDKLKGLEEAVR